MKRIQSIAAIALLAAASAYAQTTYEPPMSRGIPDSFGPPVRSLEQPAQAAPVESVGRTVTITRPAADTTSPPQLVMNVRRHGKDADARRCLQNASNKQVHRCAQPYLPHGAQASVKRTKAAKAGETAAPEAAVSGPRSKTAADIGKADLSKAGSPAKPVDMTVKPAATPAPPPTTAAVIQKPAATPAPAAPQKAEVKSDRPPKWTDSAKGVMKSQGNHLPE